MKPSVYKSTCRVCHGGCGALVHVSDGRVVKVLGDPSSPISGGWMCVKGLRSPDIANHPDRLKTPLKRKQGQDRGSGQWEEISWETALDEIAGRVAEIRHESGAESIALGQGTGRHHYMHVVRFANALGTPNWYEPGLAQCFIPRITVSNITYGGFVTADYYGETKPACILFWGHNPLVTSADGELAISVRKAMRDGCRTIAVDPRRSETARKCEMWLPVRPGTDTALALAMINTIISGGLYDRDFVENWTSGFAELKNHIGPFTPQWAEKITGVKAADIVQAATLYATTKPAILEWGLGIEQNVNSLQAVRALAILRAITGNIDTPGGDIIGMNILKSYPVLKDKLPPEAAKKRLGADQFKLLGGWRAYMPSAHIPALFRAMRDGDPYRIRALLVFGNNALLTVANPKNTYEALNKLDLLVVTDLFMTPTASLADYVLPAAFWPEVEHLMGFPLVAENNVIAQPRITQNGQCRQDEWIIDELSKRLNLPDSDITYRDIFDYQLSPLNMRFDELIDRGPYCPPHKYRKYLEKGFRTPSGKVELYSSVLKRMGYDPLPTYLEPPESPMSTPELHEDYPFVLITGSRKAEFFHSEHRQVESLRKLSPDPCAEMHVSAASDLGIADGDWIIVSSPRGQISMKAKVTENIHPSVVSVEHGWWFPEKAGEGFGLFESNANVLTSDSPPYNTAFGSYQLRGLLCSVRKK
ncbi:MAG: molybdopterin-dependent oxidoreductase [Nitrospirae bacterium]|nr:molybdopterin-dependent oxidoreductase [Nitrospirota bacterium]